MGLGYTQGGNRDQFLKQGHLQHSSREHGGLSSNETPEAEAVGVGPR